MNSEAYQVLGLTPDADREVVKAAYRALSKQNHPDQAGDKEEFRRINAAYEAIINEEPFSDPKEERQGESGNQNGLFGGFFSDEPVETKSSFGDPERGLTIEGDYLTASVIGLQHNADIRDIVYEHTIEERPGHHRTVILYDLHNISDQVLAWRSTYGSKYIGTDGYTYEHSEYLVDDSRIQPPWTGFSVELEGGARGKMIEIVEQMPEGIKLEKIIHKLSIHAKGRVGGFVEDQERFEFVIDEADYPELTKPPK
jgi:hypothetical protein